MTGATSPQAGGAAFGREALQRRERKDEHKDVDTIKAKSRLFLSSWVLVKRYTSQGMEETTWLTHRAPKCAGPIMSLLNAPVAVRLAPFKTLQ